MEKYTVDGLESDVSDKESLALHQKDKRPKKSVTAPKLSLWSEDLDKLAFVHIHPSRNIHIPKSISISEMMKLGKAISKELTTIDLFTFDFGMQTWSTLPQVIQLLVDEEPFAEGGFRKAFKAEFQGGRIMWKISRALGGKEVQSRNAEKHQRAWTDPRVTNQTMCAN